MSSRARTSAKRSAAGVDLDDDAFIRGLHEAVGQLVLRTERDLMRVGIKAQNEARRFCPVDTGRLRASIVAKEGHDARGMYVEIGTNVVYAPHVEYGTKHSAAQPFLRPGVLAAVRSFGR